MAKVSTHQIRVETEEENVTVMIGGDGGVPGGFAKFFNRAIDSGAWARLPDAAKSAYMVLVRFADHKDHFRVKVGQAALMKYSGLSRSSIKRALKDLLSSKLLVLVEQGGVTADGQNECNLYQLMVPADPKARLGQAVPHGFEQAVRQGSLQAGKPAPLGLATAPGAGSSANPPPVRQRTPSRFSAEPPVGASGVPGPDQRQTGRGAHAEGKGGFASGPQLRRIKEHPEDNSRSAQNDAAVLLEEKGVEPAAARELAALYPHERIIDVVATMEFRKARGKCDNPGGFIRDALIRQWATPRAVVEARRQAENRLRAQAADREAQQQRAKENARAGDEECRVQQVIDSLDDEELEILAGSVLQKYEGNAAVLQVLTRRTPRECRLMKMEIAAMVGRAAQV